VQIGSGAREVLPVCSILLGFLFAFLVDSQLGFFLQGGRPALHAEDSVCSFLRW
jgi:hypothetical protein